MASRFKSLFKLPGRFFQRVVNGLGRSRQRFRNWRLRKVKIDYIFLYLSGSFPERNGPPRSFIEKRLPLPPPPLSIETFQKLITRLAEADNLHGVIFSIDGLALPLGRLQTIRGEFERLRDAGKRVVVYCSMFDNGTYYLATAADQIICPPAGMFNVVGLYQEVTFLRDALKFVGIELANIQISPFKTAANNLSDQTMSPEMREQLTWLLEDRFDQLTSAMAGGRQMSAEQLRALIDNAPYSPAEAVENRLIDLVAYEDELPNVLHRPDWRTAGPEEKEKPLKIQTWRQSRRKLRGRYKSPLRSKKIAVVPLEGAIIPGQSRQPPIDLPIPIIGGSLAGDRTISKMFRQVERDDEVAAVVFYVDSRGGSALASDLMAREVERIGRKKPVVVYMGDIAASGGYYVSALANEIVCQPGTITGSIGVVTVRPVMEELYEKLKMNRVALQRGDMADLFSVGPFRDEHRQKLWNGILGTYDQFKAVVSRGRDIPKDQLDPICEGRVWTGRQALAHRLVDRHGSIQLAIDRAIKLANLDVGDDQLVVVENVYPEKGGMPRPLPFEGDHPQELWPWIRERLGFFKETLLVLPFEIMD